MAAPALRPPLATRHDLKHAGTDLGLLSATLLLIVFGLAMVFSASSAVADQQFGDAAYFLKHQVLYLVIGLVAGFFAYRIDYRKLQLIAAPLLLTNIVALIAVLIPHVGLATGGARRWLGHGAVSLQPSEFAKLAVVIYLATILSRTGGRVRVFKNGLLPLAATVIFTALWVMLEPDMGTASLIVFTGFVMLYVSGARLIHISAIFTVLVPIASLFVLHSEYKRARILAFLHPWQDPQNTGFHIVQSLLALGSGGMFGLGLGFSRQKFFWLPEPYTDFIFAILGEECGLIGELVVIGAFVFFAWRAIRLANAAPDRFGFLLAVGCTTMIVLQAFINIGVVTSSWPVTGVPLPFISYGGSSLIINIVAVALLLNVGRYRRIR